MRASRVLTVLGRFAAVLIPIAAAGCSQLRTDVAVGIGTEAYQTEPAKPYAFLYRPYAEMASLAYTDKQFLSDRRPQCPSLAKLRDPTLVDANHSAQDNQTAAGRLYNLHHVEGWSCLFGHVGVIDCPRAKECVDGLEYHVWRRNDCKEAVIAFRGSDPNDVGDWLSDLRWFIPRPLFDQYDQVNAAVHSIIDEIYRRGCHPGRIIATGHSLGGGLAQHVAYADKRIGYVYAFDPSPVTAFFEVPFVDRSAATKALGIDRIYETGEILSLPRYIVSGVFPTSQCQPRVRIVRFAVVAAPSLIDRHRINNLVTGMNSLVEKSARPAQVPYGFEHARNCDFVRPDKYGD
jgi:hypothetical protein